MANWINSHTKQKFRSDDPYILFQLVHSIILIYNTSNYWSMLFNFSNFLKDFD